MIEGNAGKYNSDDGKYKNNDGLSTTPIINKKIEDKARKIE